MTEDIVLENVDQKTAEAISPVEKVGKAPVAKHEEEKPAVHAPETGKSQSQASSVQQKGIKDINKMFSASSTTASAITSLVKQITDLVKIRQQLLSEHAELKYKIKPQRRKDRKLDILNEKKESITSQERILILAKQEYIKSRLVMVDERLYLLRQDLKLNAQKAKGAFRLETLKNKAQSKSYIKKNCWFIKTRLLKFLNEAISGDSKDRIIELSDKAKEESDEGKKIFSQTLEDFIYEADEEIYILCSYDLRRPLFEAIRLTLKSWDAIKGTNIEKLQLNEE